MVWGPGRLAVPQLESPKGPRPGRRAKTPRGGAAIPVPLARRPRGGAGDGHRDHLRGAGRGVAGQAGGGVLRLLEPAPHLGASQRRSEQQPGAWDSPEQVTGAGCRTQARGAGPRCRRLAVHLPAWGHERPHSPPLEEAPGVCVRARLARAVGAIGLLRFGDGAGARKGAQSAEHPQPSTETRPQHQPAFGG